MPWKEILDTGDSQGDGNTFIPERVFRVWGVPKAMILVTPGDILGGESGVESLPSYNEEHPDYAGLGGIPQPRLDRYIVTTSPNAAGTWDARALYSTDGRFRFQTQGGIPDEVLRYGGSGGSVEVELPFARRRYAEGTDTDARPIGMWAIDKIVVTSPISKRTVTVRVPGSAFGAQPHMLRNFVDQQANRIHRLEFADGSNLHAEFMGWTHREVDTDIFELTYDWQVDAGTPLINFPVSGLIGPVEQSGIPMPKIDYPRAGFGGIPAGGFASYDGQGGFLRPPFHALVMLLPPDHAEDFGTWYAQPAAYRGSAAELEAWRQFPGLS